MILSELAFGFLQSFKYTLPPFLDINANKYSPNHILSDKDETSFTFKIRKKITDPIKIEEPEDFPLLLKNQISPNLKLIKKNITKLFMKLCQYIQNCQIKQKISVLNSLCNTFMTMISPINVKTLHIIWHYSK